MLAINVSENKQVKVTFDISGSGKNIICYYVREVKLKVIPNETDFAQQLRRTITTALNGNLFREVIPVYPTEEWTWTLRMKELNGFHCLGFFVVAIGVQYNVLIEHLTKTLDIENFDIQVEMVLDVIY